MISIDEKYEGQCYKDGKYCNAFEKNICPIYFDGFKHIPCGFRSPHICGLDERESCIYLLDDKLYDNLILETYCFPKYYWIETTVSGCNKVVYMNMNQVMLTVNRSGSKFKLVSGYPLDVSISLQNGIKINHKEER